MAIVPARADCSAAVVPRGLRQLPRRVHRSPCHVALSRVGSPAAGLPPRLARSAAPNGRARAASAGFSRATCEAPPRLVPMSNRPLDLSVSAVGPAGLPCRPQVNGYTLAILRITGGLVGGVARPTWRSLLQGASGPVPADCSAAVVPRGLRQLPRRVHRSPCHVALSRVGSPAAGLAPRPKRSADPSGRSGDPQRDSLEPPARLRQDGARCLTGRWTCRSPRSALRASLVVRRSTAIR